jgi:hypothetical protein
MNYVDRIAIEPGKRCGRPVIRGLRITVYDVLGWLADGMTAEQMMEDFRLCYVLCGQGVRSLWFTRDPGLASPRRWKRGSMLDAGGLRVDKAWMSLATVGTGWGQLA